MPLPFGPTSATRSPGATSSAATANAASDAPSYWTRSCRTRMHTPARGAPPCRPRAARRSSSARASISASRPSASNHRSVCAQTSTTPSGRCSRRSAFRKRTSQTPSRRASDPTKTGTKTSITMTPGPPARSEADATTPAGSCGKACATNQISPACRKRPATRTPSSPARTLPIDSTPRRPRHVRKIPSAPTCTASSTLSTAARGGHRSGIPVRHAPAHGTHAATRTARRVDTRNASVTSGQYIGSSKAPAKPHAWTSVGSARASDPKSPQ